MSSTNRTSRRSRDEDSKMEDIPSLKDRFAMAGQAAHPLSHTAGGNGSSSVNQIAGTTLPRTFLSESLPVGALESEQIYAIPLDLIDTNPYNARHLYREDRIKEMAITLAADGQLQPALATLRGGRYVLAAGHYRLRGAKLAGLPTLKLTLRKEMSDRELFELSYKENNEREGQSALDNAISWSKALQDGIYENEAQLAEANNISWPTVNKTLALLKLPEDTLDEIKLAPNVFGLSVLYELHLFAQVAGPSQTLAMAQQISKGEVSRREIEAARRSFEKPKTRKPREGARQYKIVSDKAQIGTIKEWDSGKVVLEVKIADPSKRSELVADLCKRFELNLGEQ